MRYLSFVVLCSWLLPTTTSAAENSAPYALELGVGSNITKFDYRELCTPWDSESANYTSLLSVARVHATESLSFIEGRYETATTTSQYKGAYLTTNQPVTATDTLKFTDYAVTVNLALSDSVYIYGGYGHHVWNRFLAGGSGYREIYSWDYNPVGLTAWFMKGETADLGVDLSLKPMSHGKIQAVTSETISGGQDSSAALGAKTGFKVKLPITWHAGALMLQTSPWFEHFEIGESNVITNTTLFQAAPHQGLEPNSDTSIWGLEVLAGVRF